MQLAKRVKRIKPSVIRQILERVVGRPDIINLGIGEPDFDTPPHIVKAGIRALEQGYTHYGRLKGDPELLSAISNRYKKLYSLNYDPESEIMIGNGTTSVIFAAIASFVEPGSSAVIFDPGYVEYGPASMISGGRVNIVPLYEEFHFNPDPEELKQAVNKKTRLIIFASPNNPTGMAFKRSILKTIADLAEDYDCMILSDEIYDQMYYERKHLPIAKFARERTITIGGFSKQYAMTGWRLGWACAPKQVIDAMAKLQYYSLLVVNTAVQRAGITALKASQRCCSRMMRIYRRRRDYVIKELSKIPGFRCHPPDAAFYAFPYVGEILKKLNTNSVLFAEKMLQEAKVAVVPGAGFGKKGEDYIRISFSNSMDNIREGLNRIKIFIEKVF